MSKKRTADLTHGDLIDGKYVIDKEIGAGGMGAVFMATHTTIGRKVAIKTLHAEFTEDAEVVARFHREAQLAGSIGHDNICEVTDLGTLEDGAPYLVMPLLSGKPLTDVLARSSELTLARVADMGCQTLSALAAAHGAGIVHRDLKPDNIFITRMGDRADFVKLLDFGISKIMEQDEVNALTMTGTVMGTPFYMAPEQAKGSKQLDHRVDIYAMGVILYEALTGVRPYTGDSYNEIMFKIISEPFVAPSVLNTSIPPLVEQVIIKAMEKDQEDRYLDAEEMREALDTAARGIAMDFGARFSNAPTIGSGGYTGPGSTGEVTFPGPATTGLRAAETISPGDQPNGKSKIPIIVAAAAVLLAGVIGAVVFGLMGGDDATAQVVSPAKPAAVVPLPVVNEEAPKPVQDAGAQVQAVDEEPKIVVPQQPAEDEEELVKSSSGKKKKKKSKKSSEKKTPVDETPKKKKTVGGRFGTTFVGEYED